jgi:hypothetical protein
VQRKRRLGMSRAALTSASKRYRRPCVKWTKVHACVDICSSLSPFPLYILLFLSDRHILLFSPLFSSWELFLTGFLLCSQFSILFFFQEEDGKLVHAVQILKISKWKSVAAYVGTKNPNACCKYWTNPAL